MLNSSPPYCTENAITMKKVYFFYIHILPHVFRAYCRIQNNLNEIDCLSNTIQLSCCKAGRQWRENDIMFSMRRYGRPILVSTILLIHWE